MFCQAHWLGEKVPYAFSLLTNSLPCIKSFDCRTCNRTGTVAKLKCKYIVGKTRNDGTRKQYDSTALSVL